MTEIRKQIESRTRSVRGWVLPFIILTSPSLIFLVACSQAAPSITTFDKTGQLTWTNALVPGVSTVEVASALSSNWTPTQNAYSVVSTGSVVVPVIETNKFIRLRSVDVSPTASGFTNLIQSYGLLETICGDGVGRSDPVSYWQPQFEGGVAAFASLSRPHYAMADQAGNIYIADKNSHSVLRVSTNGTVHTHAGSHSGGFNGDGPATATTLQLNFPNALWVRGDGVVYVLDTDNGRVRRINTNGVMTTLANVNGGASINGGRMLWVQDDQSVLYYGNKTSLKKWTPSDGVSTYSSGFTEIGNFFVEPNGNILLADRGANYVWRIFTNNTRVIIAGNGNTSGGTNGSPATSVGFNGPRGIWPVPTGGYLLLLHDGAQLWYVDSANKAWLMLNGTGGNFFVHAGDGQYFYDLNEARIGEGRSVSMDYAGNIIICESDYGFIRRIRFQRMTP